MPLRRFLPASGVAALVFFLGFRGEARAADFIRGDSNRDGVVDLSDPIHALSCAFILDCEFGPGCLDASDADDSGFIDLTDAIFTLAHLFLGGRTIPPPYPTCGADPTEDGRGCESYDACPPAPGGRLVKWSDCGGFAEGGGAGGASSREECLRWSFSSGVLSLRHEDLGLSCCVDVAATVSFDGGTIEIAESEDPWPDGPCRCLCLYDADYEVTGLAPGPYLIRLTGSLGGLEAVIDLSEGPSGSRCEERPNDPWGG
jgi:hypothetical protein